MLTRLCANTPERACTYAGKGNKLSQLRPCAKTNVFALAAELGESKILLVSPGTMTVKNQIFTPWIAQHQQLWIRETED